MTPEDLIVALLLEQIGKMGLCAIVPNHRDVRKDKAARE